MRVDTTITVFTGGSNTVGLDGPIGWRTDCEEWLLQNQEATYSDQGASGQNSWESALRIAEIVAVNPSHIVVECAVNDSELSTLSSDRTNGWLTTSEAFIVRLRTALPDARILFASAVGHDDYVAQAYIDSRDRWVTINAHHDVPMARMDEKIISLYGDPPSQEEHDAEIDGAHLTEQGHHHLFDEIENQPLEGYYPPNSGVGWTGDLADYQPYIYDDMADWLHDPILRNGTDNDGETGSGWADNGTARVSSTADDTIEWTGTMTAFGLDVVAQTCTFGYSIDGGGYTNVDQSAASGAIRPLYSLERDSHTITIKVVSGTVEINRFLAT